MMVGWESNFCDRVKGGGCPLGALRRWVTISSLTCRSMWRAIDCCVKGLGHRRGVVPNTSAQYLFRAQIDVRFASHQLADDVVDVVGQAVVVGRRCAKRAVGLNPEDCAELRHAVDADAKAAVAETHLVSCAARSRRPRGDRKR